MFQRGNSDDKMEEIPENILLVVVKIDKNKFDFTPVYARMGKTVSQFGWRKQV